MFENITILSFLNASVETFVPYIQPDKKNRKSISLNWLKFSPND